MARSRWGPGEVLLYEEAGTTTDVHACGICGARNLDEVVVLIAHTVDGELAGTMHACDPCGAQAAARDAQTGRGSYKDDPRLSDRRRR